MTNDPSPYLTRELPSLGGLAEATAKHMIKSAESSLLQAVFTQANRSEHQTPAKIKDAARQHVEELGVAGSNKALEQAMGTVIKDGFSPHLFRRIGIDNDAPQQEMANAIATNVKEGLSLGGDKRNEVVDALKTLTQGDIFHIKDTRAAIEKLDKATNQAQIMQLVDGLKPSMVETLRHPDSIPCALPPVAIESISPAATSHKGR